MNGPITLIGSAKLDFNHLDYLGARALKRSEGKCETRSEYQSILLAKQPAWVMNELNVGR